MLRLESCGYGSVLTYENKDFKKSLLFFRFACMQMYFNKLITSKKKKKKKKTSQPQLIFTAFYFISFCNQTRRM